MQAHLHGSTSVKSLEYWNMAGKVEIHGRGLPGHKFDWWAAGILSGLMWRLWEIIRGCTCVTTTLQKTFDNFDKMLCMRSKDLQELMPAAVSNLQPKINMDKCCSSGFEPLGVYSPLYHRKPLGIGLANHALGHFCRPQVEWPWQPFYS